VDIISIQLVSPASGDRGTSRTGCPVVHISIQLVSPASGDHGWSNSGVRAGIYFHSISFPSEWGPLASGCQVNFPEVDFHSISFPSEWGLGDASPCGLDLPDFHSISFPSEWGRHRAGMDAMESLRISIQLVSPASGDRWKPEARRHPAGEISIQLVSPASGDMILMIQVMGEEP